MRGEARSLGCAGSMKNIGPRCGTYGVIKQHLAALGRGQQRRRYRVAWMISRTARMFGCALLPCRGEGQGSQLTGKVTGPPTTPPVTTIFGGAPLAGLFVGCVVNRPELDCSGSL